LQTTIRVEHQLSFSCVMRIYSFKALKPTTTI